MLRSRRSALRAASFAAACLTALSPGPPAVADGGPARLRAVVRVTSPADRGFLARVRGQTSDLPVDLVEQSAAALEPTLGQQVAAAEALAHTANARVVFWLAGEQMLAYVASAPGVAAQPRLLARRAWEPPAPDSSSAAADHQPPAAPAPAPASAALEAAALIARSALKAIVEGQQVGEPRPPAPPALEPAPPPPPPPAPHHPLAGWVAVGWMATADGVPHDPAGGFTARGGARLGRLAAGLAFSRVLAKEVPRAPENTQHRRQSIVALAAFDVARRGRFRLAAEVEAGYERFWLTEPLDPNTTPPTLGVWRFLTGAELRGAVALWSPRHAAAELTLGVGSDFVPSPPSIRLLNGTTISKLWRFEPRGILGLEVTLR